MTMITQQKIERDILESLRYLLLAIPLEEENQILGKVNSFLNELGVELFERAKYIKLQYDIWKSENRLTKELKNIIHIVFSERTGDFKNLTPEKYLELHEKLITKFYFSFEESSILLSYLNLIIYFALKEKMSSAKVAQMLLANDKRLEKISWRVIQYILQILKLKPSLSKNDVEQLYSIDISFEEVYFADADIHQASMIVGQVAKDLGFPKNLTPLLNKLVANEEIFFPYIQILHYQSIICEFYNHVLSTLYEFSPRGAVADFIFDKYSHLVSTGNPILNNAKAVDTLDIYWARSKEDNIEQAYALAEILQGFTEMGYSTSHELASWVRRWTLRVIRLQNVPETTVPHLNLEQVQKLLTFISSFESETYGIIEQRIVDAITSYKFREEKGWRSRGLGDSVNTNNLSRRKLGDCDFQNATSYSVHGFEAHGGKLTATYFESHKRSFLRSFSRRVEELEGITDLHNWNVLIEYIAHSYSTPPSNIDFKSILDIQIKFTLFVDYINELLPIDQELIDSVNQFVVNSINSSKTPNFVRQKLLNIIL